LIHEMGRVFLVIGILPSLSPDVVIYDYVCQGTCGAAGALRAMGSWNPRSPNARDRGHPARAASQRVSRSARRACFAHGVSAFPKSQRRDLRHPPAHRDRAAMNGAQLPMAQLPMAHGDSSGQMSGTPIVLYFD
jgi:hypothetical protein